MVEAKEEFIEELPSEDPSVDFILPVLEITYGYQ